MNAAQIAKALGGHRSGNQWKCKCPAHDDADPSMIVFDGRESVQVRCYAGCEPLEIIAALRARGLWGEDVDGDNSSVNGSEPCSLVEARRADPDRHYKLAMKIWDASVDPAGTAAEVYLNGRGLEMPPKASEVIGYHPRCPNAQLRAPALVALMRNVETFKPQAVQRLFLARDETRCIVKTEGMMLGPVGHAAMMITSRHDTFWDCLSFCPKLYVCEGLETGLALHQAGQRPVWALGSAGAIERLPVLFGVGQLVICADNDNSSIGLQCAIVCAARWNATTHQKATIIMPAAAGSDFADNLKGV